MEKGCNLGNEIFPQSTGQFNVPFNPDVERFTTNNPIKIRWWYAQDPNCGILVTKLTPTGKRCIVNNTFGTGIVSYNQNDVSVCNVPIDGPVYACFIIFALLAIRKFKL